jgi:glycosyltransferase involved in cell wall biosynthesis
MNQATVSVVIPVYNNGPYIAAAVKSVLAQTRPADEILVIDDGSTDNTAAELEPFRNQIRYLYQQNRGEPTARNRGIREARSEYIAFLDADDMWMPDKLELQMEYLHRHPSCYLVYADMSTFDDNGIVDASVKARFRVTLPTGRVFRHLFMRSLFGPGTVVFRKECVEKVGYFDESLFVGSDYDMWLRISRHFDFGVIDQPLLMYRFHDAMATRGLGLKLNNGVPWEVVVLQKILDLYPEAINELGRTAVNRRLSKPWAGLAYARFNSSDFKSARALFRKAAAAWPTNLRYLAYYGMTFLQPAQVETARRFYKTLVGMQADEHNETSTAKAA